MDVQKTATSAVAIVQMATGLILTSLLKCSMEVLRVIRTSPQQLKDGVFPKIGVKLLHPLVRGRHFGGRRSVCGSSTGGLRII